MKIGFTSGRLVVVEELGLRYTNAGKCFSSYLCVCECGSVIEVSQSNLKRNHSQSCGCYKRERCYEANIKHGDLASVEYRAWSEIKRRCYNRNCLSFKNYGGRGIVMCDRWLNSYSDFLSDMGRKPSPSHSLDRIDVNRGYEPDNCRWATKQEQNSNTRRNRFIEHSGKRLTLSEWSRITGIPRITIGRRIDYFGWSVERALTVSTR